MLQVHRFDPVPSTGAPAAGRQGLHFHSVGITGGPGGQTGRESAEQWQSLEGIMLELGHEWLEVLSVGSRSDPLPAPYLMLRVQICVSCRLLQWGCCSCSTMGDWT